MRYSIYFQNATTVTDIPTRFDFKRWVDEALKDLREAAEVTIRIVDEDEMTHLNQTYRKKQGPTNVLSFPYEGPKEVEPTFLGDIVICAPLVQQEAISQNKSVINHWAHLVIHGILHLLGYDHIKDDEAIIMETLEINILSRLGIADPYGSNTMEL